MSPLARIAETQPNRPTSQANITAALITRLIETLEDPGYEFWLSTFPRSLDKEAEEFCQAILPQHPEV